MRSQRSRIKEMQSQCLVVLVYFLGGIVGMQAALMVKADGPVSLAAFFLATASVMMWCHMVTLLMRLFRYASGGGVHL